MLSEYIESESTSDNLADEVWKLTLEDRQNEMEENDMEELDNEKSNADYKTTLSSEPETNCKESGTDKCDIRNRPAYPDSHIKVETVMLLICLLMIKHNFTQTVIDDLLTILTVILPNGNTISRNYSEFKKFFAQLKYPLKLHYYCSACLMPVASKTTASCPNKTCQKELAGKGAISYFVEVPILGQLATFFNRKGFYNLLQH